jgi:hypothetical protein
MPEMKAMEFTDKLNLQPVTRPVPQPKARNPDSGLRHWSESYREALVYHQSLCGWLDTIQGIPGHEFSRIVAGLGAILADEKCR